MVLILDHCHRLVEMWFWFGALVSWVAREALGRTDPSFGKDYLATAAQAKVVTDWLVKSFNEHLGHRQEELRSEQSS
jgi:hypothetical protein